MFDNKTNRHGH